METTATCPAARQVPRRSAGQRPQRGLRRGRIELVARPAALAERRVGGCDGVAGNDVQSALRLAFEGKDAALAVQQQGEGGHLEPLPESIAVGVAEQQLVFKVDDKDGATDKRAGIGRAHKLLERAVKGWIEWSCLPGGGCVEARKKGMPNPGPEPELHF